MIHSSLGDQFKDLAYLSVSDILQDKLAISRCLHSFGELLDSIGW